MNAVEGVNVKTTVDVSWYSLGLHTLSNEIDSEQVALLEGFGSGLRALTSLQSEMQLQYIADKVLKTPETYENIVWLIDGLHARLHEGETA